MCITLMSAKHGPHTAQQHTRRPQRVRAHLRRCDLRGVSLSSSAAQHVTAQQSHTVRAVCPPAAYARHAALFVWQSGHGCILLVVVGIRRLL
ncbi:unnamed protein product [Sphagnum balticum]